MKIMKWKLGGWLAVCAALVLAASPLRAEECQTSTEMNPATRTAIEAAAMQFFNDLAHNDAASLQQHAIGSLASNFAAVQAAVTENQPMLGGATATTRVTYLLDASSGSGVLPQAEFYCGLANGPEAKFFTSFVIPNLPAGVYALVIEDAKGPKGPYYVTFILQQEQAGGAWKLAGLPPPQPAEVLGHDAPWYLEQARQFKAKGQTLNAWFYYEQARTLADPVAFMSTTPLRMLASEMQSAQPAQLPISGPVPLAAANGQSYSLIKVFPVLNGDGMDLVVRYAQPDISDTAKDFQNNMAVIQALVSKYPELRQTFQGVVARAVDPSGKDYGTLLAMKDIK